MIDIENFVETGELLPADLQLQQRQAGGFDGPVRQFPFDTRRKRTLNGRQSGQAYKR